MRSIKTTRLLTEMKAGHPDKRLRVCILGLGLGSRIADEIARELLSFYRYICEHRVTEVAKKWLPVVTLIDGDEFTMSKADHEVFSRKGPKPEVKKEDIARIFPELEVKTISRELWVPNTKRMLGDQDIVVAFTDVNNMKFYLSKWFGKNKRNGILITGGVHESADGGFIRAYLRGRGKDLTPPIEHGLEISSRDMTIKKNGGDLQRRYSEDFDDRRRKSRTNRNRIMSLMSGEVVNLFRSILEEEIFYDTVEITMGRDSWNHINFFKEREAYFRGDEYYSEEEYKRIREQERQERRRLYGW